ncbi:MAG: bifunctional metallophosphatase/5'-nucleotidase [Acidobacteria bacterium]|nr:bifunctional metallophosphatase/5'-nucleotidase [Acidobacteriota bacterium]MBI3663934.1 bifunctional metallophosphatase/5'-nucleotidase [Acidobacteriota bacterium]
MLRRYFLLSGFVFCCALFVAFSPHVVSGEEQVREVTILYTNDFHSAFDPIPAYWMPGTPKLGGAAQLAALINQIRQREKTVFLFDTGDMFTGMLSFLTRGEALMEMMMSISYDAMAIGNHEFDYGSENFSRQMNAVPFPVLGANIFYKGTDHPYSRPYTILERHGVRLGVIGIIGQDARSVALPSGITNLEFMDPIPVVRAAVTELRPQVDLIVVLAHQGKTGPMQTDAEAHPDLQRDFDEDVRLCGEVAGIDVFVGGHAHRGIEKPFVHPQTGTLIVQTYGYGTRLGYLKLRLQGKKIVSHEGELLKVWSDKLTPDPVVAAKVRFYKEKMAAEIGGVVGQSKVRLVRDYRAESLLGAFVADVMRKTSSAAVGITNAGGLRADLPEGPITRGDVLDALPFANTLVLCEMTGAQIREVLEQGFTLERGMVQVSGLRARYDMSRPSGKRLVELRIGGLPAEDQKVYRVATNSFLAQGGDLYQTFLQTKQDDTTKLISTVVMEYLQKQGAAGAPEMGRLVPVTPRAHEHD